VSKPGPGRPPTTTRHEIQQVALDLFATRGFEETTLDDVAAAVGVARRTLFRYYASKNDLVWGEFDEHLEGLRVRLAESPADEPVMAVLRRAVVAFNDYGDDQQPELRIRMTLITSVPALQGHSMLRYREWSAVVAEFVAARLGPGAHADDHVPQVIADATLGACMATYRHWIARPGADLLQELDRALRLLAAGFADDLLP
jgi:mycofactocin system transcriptional regulator